MFILLIFYRLLKNLKQVIITKYKGQYLKTIVLYV